MSKADATMNCQECFPCKGPIRRLIQSSFFDLSTSCRQQSFHSINTVASSAQTEVNDGIRFVDSLPLPESARQDHSPRLAITPQDECVAKGSFPPFLAADEQDVRCGLVAVFLARLNSNLTWLELEATEMIAGQMGEPVEWILRPALRVQPRVCVRPILPEKGVVKSDDSFHRLVARFLARSAPHRQQA